MATRTPQTLIDWATLTTTATATSYSVPATADRTICGRLQFYNSAAVPRTVTINLINLTGTTKVFYVKKIAAGKTWTCPDIEGTVFTYSASNPHTINMAQDSGTDVNVFMSGTEIAL